MLPGRKLCQLMEQIHPKTGNPLAFFLISILFISCIINLSNKNYHDTGENQFSTEHIGGLVSITFFQLTNQLQPKTGNTLAVFDISILLILCLPSVSDKFYHGTGEYQPYAQHKISTGECCLEEHCVSSWISYGLKRGIPWHFLVYLYFINIMSSVVVMDHRMF